MNLPIPQILLRALLIKLPGYCGLSFLEHLAISFIQKMADRKISKIISLELPEKETNEKIKKAGGTTLIPHLFIGVLLILVFYLAHQGLINVG